jgi:hypothetical protein
MCVRDCPQQMRRSSVRDQAIHYVSAVYAVRKECKKLDGRDVCVRGKEEVS